MFFNVAAVVVTTLAATALSASAAPASDEDDAALGKRYRIAESPPILKYCNDYNFAPPCADSPATLSPCTNVPDLYQHAISSIQLTALYFTKDGRCLLFSELGCPPDSLALYLNEARPSISDLRSVNEDNKIRSFHCYTV